MKLKRILSIKMEGDDVSNLQSKLKEIGFFNDQVDSYFGQNTLSAVSNFQKSVGMKVDGIVGSLTWSKIINYNLSEKEAIDIPYNKSFIDKDIVIYDCKISDDLYIKEEVKKNTIWLHHTSGGSRPDWSIGGWEKDYLKDKSGNPVIGADGNIVNLKVATSYIIGRKSSSTGESLWDGKILKTFDDRYWAHHLGIIDNNFMELNSSSIGIELCNYGPLTVGMDGRFYNFINKPIPESEVVKLNKPYRGYEYYERYTDAQIESTRNLIIYLIKRWQIPIDSKIYNENWFNFDKKWASTGGLRSHSQIRRDKFDIFPQPEMIQMLNSF